MKLFKMNNFIFFYNVFYALCILRSFNIHIPVVVLNFFEFGTVSKWCIREWVNRQQKNEIQNPAKCKYHNLFSPNLHILKRNVRNYRFAFTKSFKVDCYMVSFFFHTNFTPNMFAPKFGKCRLILPHN